MERTARTGATSRGEVLVTGAASGIGRGIAVRCVKDGYDVLALDRDEAGLAALREELGERIDLLVLDLTAPELEEKLGEHLRARPLRGLVNAAGISQGDDIDGIEDGDWQRSMEVNVTAPMRLVRALLPNLRACPGAAIVNVGSPVGIIGARKVSYAASKAALLGLNAALAQNLAGDGIRVNAILPGPTLTAMTSDWPPAKQQSIGAEGLIGRLAEPADIAGPVSFLLSEDASYITAEVLNVTGGKNVGI